MRRSPAKILHIASHLGGGVGRALSSIVTSERRNDPHSIHKILLLDDPEKDQFLNICRDGGVEVMLKSRDCDVGGEMAAADIVVLHWWHHPAMAEFLSTFPATPLRLVLWSHVNGCNYPCLPFEFVDLPQKTFFTSPFSFENPYWSERQRAKIKKTSAVVYGLGELQFQPAVKKPRSADFVIGYVGTLSSSKLHPRFMEFCCAVLKKVPNARFVLVGDMNTGNDIQQQASAYRIDSKFSFIGYSNQIMNELSKFDVFAYPLNPRHFGTTENVLLEAMALGLPVVALNHNTEKYIVKSHKKVGLLADSIEHYAASIKYLYDNPRERARIGANAREYVRNNFTFENNVSLMRAEFRKVLRMPRRQFSFGHVFGTRPYEWFLSCLGEDRETFSASISGKLSSPRMDFIEGRIMGSSPILREKTKSSITHFAESFPGDENLRYWKSLLSGKGTHMNGPLVSIGIAAYNRLDGLRRTLECFTRQTYQNLEIIVSDNCSPDDPSEMVREFALKDKRIKYYRQEKNIGMGLNTRFVWEKATGKYFVLGSDDDWWSPFFVSELLAALLAEEGAACAFCDFEEVDEQGRKIISRSRYAGVRKLLGLKIHSYPDHYPLLKEFTCKDPVERLKSFIMQKEYDGKANVHRALCDRKFFLDSVAILRRLGLWECWAFDQLLAFVILAHGRLALSSKLLFKCTVGNQKHYADPRSRLAYLEGYASIVDSRMSAAEARELKKAVSVRYMDRTVGFQQEYSEILGNFTEAAAASPDSVPLELLKSVCSLITVGDHHQAAQLAKSIPAAAVARKTGRMAGALEGFLAAGEKKFRLALAKEILKKAGAHG